MKVVEKDRVVGGMLEDELKRCQEMLNGLRKAISRLPKGAINERNKRKAISTGTPFFTVVKL